jgi:hypothetical protein
MEETTSTSFWKRAYRAYVLLKVTDKTQEVEVAKKILALNDEELDPSNQCVIRASVMKTGPFDIIVSVCASSQDLLDEVSILVKSRAGVEQELSEVGSFDNERDPRDIHHPYPPHEACGYVPQVEANPEANPSPPGPTGSNAWG